MLKSGQPFTAPHFPTQSVVGLKTAPAGPVVRDPIPLGSSKGMEGASEGGVKISNVTQIRVCLLQTVKLLPHQRKLVLVKVGNGAGGDPLLIERALCDRAMGLEIDDAIFTPHM